MAVCVVDQKIGEEVPCFGLTSDPVSINRQMAAEVDDLWRRQLWAEPGASGEINTKTPREFVLSFFFNFWFIFTLAYQMSHTAGLHKAIEYLLIADFAEVEH